MNDNEKKLMDENIRLNQELTVMRARLATAETKVTFLQSVIQSVTEGLKQTTILAEQAAREV